MNNLPFTWMNPDIDKISEKDITEITFEDTIKLFLYMAFKMALISEEWNTYYVDFLAELEKQNTRRWPKLIFTRNYTNKRLDSLAPDTFIKTNNILLLLLQLLYVEKNKQIKSAFENIDVLNHCTDSESSEDFLSTEQIFDFLDMHLRYYLSLYHNKMLCEYQISSLILIGIKNN